MREFSFTLADEIKQGLRPRVTNKQAASGLAACLNLKPYDGVLASIPALTAPITATVSWPFPQYHRGPEHKLLLFKTALKVIDESDWSSASVTMYDALSVATTCSIPAGGQWHIADFGEAVLACNGTSMIIHVAQDTAAAGYYPKSKFFRYINPAGTGTASFGSVCAFKSRAIYTALGGSLWDSLWEALIPLYQGQAASGSWATFGESYYDKMIMWSGIGRNLLFPIQFTAAKTGFGVAQADYRNIFNELKRNDFGFLYIPVAGTLLQTRQLGDLLVAYSTDGIALLRPITIDSTNTFGIIKIYSCGLGSRSAVGGNETKHLFIDGSSALWVIDAQGQLRYLGYEEFLSTLTLADTVINYNPRLDEFYISDGVTSFLLTANGLCSLTQAVMSLWYGDDGSLYYLGVVDGIDARILIREVQTSFSLTTGDFDFGNPGYKRAGAVEVMGSLISGLEAKWAVSQDGGATWVDTSWRDCNNQGEVFLPATGSNFRLSVRGTCATNGHLRAIAVRLQQSDKRFIRGI